MIDQYKNQSLTAHIDRDLYGDPDNKVIEAKQAQERQFNEMVHAAFSGSKEQGAALLEYLDGYLKSPIWFPEENTNMMPYREGARSFVQHLLTAYNAGGVPLDPKKK
jgi:hypothetical protein